MNELSTTWLTILVALAIWSAAWKAIALWKAARRDDLVWYILMLILNTAGILEIIYIFVISKNKLEK